MPTAVELKSTLIRRRRGKVLRLLQSAAPMALPDADDLYRLLQDTGESLTIYEVHELVRDLKQRGCMAYEAKRDRNNELPTLRWLRLEPRGRDVIEGTIQDPAIDVI